MTAKSGIGEFSKSGSYSSAVTVTGSAAAAFAGSGVETIIPAAAVTAVNEPTTSPTTLERTNMLENIRSPFLEPLEGRADTYIS